MTASSCSTANLAASLVGCLPSRWVRPAAAALALSLAALPAACISADADTPSGEASIAPGAVATTSNAFSFDGGHSVEGWFPTREGVVIERDTEGNAAMIRYERTRRTASGVAIQLTPESCAALEAIEIRGSSKPGQRIHICLTDANGIVWTFPTVKLGLESDVHRVVADEIAPDPFQNAGKKIPAKPDWNSMRMLTVLDISGHMGAAVEQVAWRIESIVGKEAAR
jgi:hypothetical protein